MSSPQPAPCAEFPNDNLALHRGALWTLVAALGAPAPLLPEARQASSTGAPPEPEPVPDGFDRELPESEAEIDLEADDLSDASSLPPVVSEPALVTIIELEAGADASAPEPQPSPISPRKLAREASAPADDPFATLIGALTAAALDAGATRAALALDPLLRDACLDALAGDATLTERLVRARLVERHGATVRASARLAGEAAAWRAVLRGESADLAACGSATLDDWSADLLAALLDASTERKREFKRELRRHGVAAFGLIAA
ncbi:MAG: hypothetical protein OZ921_20300 [Sorangiineae bacterium]|nr:hypothetical protein [Polyangiaceae bacterium]MEB2324866.1 hypothetical protein [Sorangiineae bacterium]